MGSLFIPSSSSPHPPPHGTTHVGTLSWKASRKYSSHATAIGLQVSPATLAQAEGLGRRVLPLPGTPRNPSLSEPWLPGQPTAQHSVARLQPRTHPS